MTGYEAVRDALVQRQSRRKGQDWQCPAHDDVNPSLGLKEGQEGRAVLYCQAGCTVEDVVGALGLEMSDLFTSNGNGHGDRSEPIVTYDYVAPDGLLAFQKLRYYPKDFKLRRPDGSGGWLWTIGDAPRVLFRLPAVLDAVREGRTVYVAEGEKDVLVLERAGVVATCNFEGAARDGQKPKWRDSYSETLAGGDVVVIADRDEAGYAHAEAVRASVQALAKSVVVVEAAEGNDAYDHLVSAQLSVADFVPLGGAKNSEEDLPQPTDLGGPIEPVRWAIPNFAPRQQITTFYATLGTGKTTVYGDAIASNEAGRLFLGLYKFEEEQQFIVFDWENGENMVKRMLSRLGADPGNLQRARVYCDVDHERFNLDTEKGRANIRRLIGRDKATCVIFDGRDSAFFHTGENEGPLIGPAMESSLALCRELDVAFVFISQEPKAEYSDSTSKLRGHSAWGQWSEQMFRLVRKGETRDLQHTKNRGVDIRPGLRVELVREGDEEDSGPLRLVASPVNRDEEREAKRQARLAEDIATIEEHLDEAGDLQRGELEAWAKSAHEIGTERFRNVLEHSELIWQPAGPRTPYSTRPKQEEDGGEQLGI